MRSSMEQLSKRFTLTLVVGVLLWCLLIHAPPCQAATVWSDDFNDGTLDGWTVDTGVFSADDHTLQGDAGMMSRASHTSTVATGTWSFDIHCGYLGIGVQFISLEIGAPLIEYYSYDITVSGRNEQIYFFRHWNYVPTRLGNYTPTTILGWHHFDITRDADGQFYVYINGTLAMEFVDTTYNSSNYFVVQAELDTAIDNIRVSDTVDISPPTTSNGELPPGIPGFPAVTIGAGLVLAMVLILGKRRKKK
ncbi:MAG: hypothetical protein ACFFCO_06815 [Promethearchaeota archaeon]